MSSHAGGISDRNSTKFSNPTSELARWIEVSVQTMDAIVSKLLEAGLAERTPHLERRRIFVLTIRS